MKCNDQMQNTAVSNTFVATLMHYVAPEVYLACCLLMISHKVILIIIMAVNDCK